MLDAAKVDDAVICVRVLEQPEPPDVQALERIYQAELAGIEAGEVLPRAPNAQREVHPAIHEAAEACHPQTVATLSRLGLVENAVGFGGVNVTVVGTTAIAEQLLNDLPEA